MMELLWSDILSRFGQDVVLREKETAVSVRAMIQPYLPGEGDQEVPGPLGLGRKDCFRYLGPPQHPLGPDTLVEWKGRDYQVRRSCLAGEGVCPHWRAVLRPRDEVEA